MPRMEDAPQGGDRLLALEHRLLKAEYNQQQTSAEVLARLDALEKRLTELFDALKETGPLATHAIDASPGRDPCDRPIPSEDADVHLRLQARPDMQSIAEKLDIQDKQGVLGNNLAADRAIPSPKKAHKQGTQANSPSTPLKGGDVQGFHMDCEAQDPSEEELIETVALESTLWDAAILLGMQRDDKQKWFVGRANRIVVVLLLVVNVVMQGIFLLAIPTTMSGKPYDDDTIKALKQQRLFTGHSYNEINRVSMKTWTANLCAENVHNRLAGTLEDIFYYLQNENSFGPPGALICLLAIAIWILSMVTEIRRALDVTCAVWSLPSTHSEGSQKNIASDGDDKLIVCMSNRYKVFLTTLVFLPRFIIAFSLMYFGVEYLADTPAVSDLILNACALEIVKNIDELLFLAILSRRFHQGVESIQIRVPHRETKMGLLLAPETTATINGGSWKWKRNYVHILMYVRIAVVAVMLILGWKVFLQPVQQSTVTAYDTICGYDRDFAYTYHPSSQLPIFTTMTAEDNSTVPLQCFYMSQYELLSIRAGMQTDYVEQNTTLERLVNGSHELCKKAKGQKMSPVSCPETDRVTELVTLSDTSAQDFLQSPLCRDEDVVMFVVSETCQHPTFIDSFQPLSKVFNGKRQVCSDFEDFCKCPQKAGEKKTDCGPTSELFRNASKNGIPPEWIRVIQGICPQTCGTCEGTTGADAGMGGSSDGGMMSTSGDSGMTSTGSTDGGMMSTSEDSGMTSTGSGASMSSSDGSDGGMSSATVGGGSGGMTSANSSSSGTGDGGMTSADGSSSATGDGGMMATSGGDGGKSSTDGGMGGVTAR